MSFKSGGATPSSDMDTSDPIAIVGMAVRLPGGVRNTEDFWNLMMDKRSGLIPIPKERWNSEGFYSPVAKWGTVQNKEAYMFSQADNDLTKFDASYFTCGEKEIERMDPMQRQLLEIARECLDNAGETNWRGEEIGCYVGNFSSDWQDDLSMDPHASGLYRGSGYLDFLQPNRVSYEYGWTGPSMLVKTGCSSSMVALHLAAEAVQNGACKSAMALGCNLITSVITSIVFTETGVLSPSGKCKTFDLLADGYGRGEAVNAVYVKRLSDALRDGNPVRAIIRASATNNDGRSNGIMSPNTYLQEALIRKTYEKAGVPFNKTAFFECHGTGTPTGDPLEVAAVARIWKDNEGVMIGAVKPNVGHSEGAAGLTSVIKAVLALENRVIPPNIYMDNPNPRIPWEEAKLSVPTEPTSWPENRDERISVNSFGVAGSNAHVILESFEGWQKLQDDASSISSDSGVSVRSPGQRLLLFSASHMTSLEKQVEQHREYLRKKNTDVDDLAYTLGHHRDHLSCRAYAIANEDGVFDPSSFKRKPAVSRRLVLAFTGQGVHWGGMGKRLIESNDVFRSTISRLDVWLQSLPESHRPSWTLEKELSLDDAFSRVGQRGYSHPCATAVQIALVDVLASLGIRPDAVTGHSGGEAAAAYAAGSISAEAAMAVAYFRGWLLVNGTVPPGTMAAVSLGPREVEPFLIPGVVVGCENSQLSTTLSGDPVCIQHCIDQIMRRHPDVKARVLNLETSFHSPWIEPLAGPYEDLLKPHLADAKAPTVPHFSSVTGLEMTGDEFGANYWRRNFVQPVLFNTAVRTLVKSNPNNLFIEVGPHPALQRPVNEILRSIPEAACEYITTLHRAEDTNLSMLRLAGELFVQGAPVDMASVIPKGRVLTDLPTYPWLHDVTYMDEPRNPSRYKQRKHTRHVLLGARVLEGNDIEPAWRNMLDLKEVPWLMDHIVNGQIVFPGAGYMAMAGEAMRQVANGQDSYTIRDMSITTGMTVPKEKKMELYTRLIPEDKPSPEGQWYHFKIMSYDGYHWVTHCSGFVRSGAEADKTTVTSAQAEQEFAREIEAEGWYKAVKAVGIDWQTAFQGLDQITANPVRREATATVYDFEDTTHYAAHPTLLDQMLQINLVAQTHGQKRRLDSILLPTFISRLGVLGNQDLCMRAYGSINEAPEGMTANAAIFTDEGRPTVYLEGLSYSELPVAKREEVLLGSTFEWKKDITMVDSVSEIESSTLDASEELRDAIRLLGFKTPDAKVIEIGSGETGVTRIALEALQPARHKRLYNSYTYVCTSEEQLDEATAAVNALEKEDVSIIDLEQLSLCHIPDVVVLSLSTLLSDDRYLQDDLTELKSMQTAGSRLIVHSQDDCVMVSNDNGDKVAKRLQSLGYTLHSKTKSGLILAEPAKRVSLEQDNTKVTILAHSTPGGRTVAEEVQSYFQAKGFKTQISSAQLVPSDGSLVISLLDLTDNTVYDLEPQTFRPFMDSLCNLRGSLIWVIPSVHGDCKDARPAMIQGTARTVRMENKADITLVEADDLPATRTGLPDALFKICQSLPNRRKGGDLDADYDYAIMDGNVHIPRMYWFGFSDPDVSKALPAARETPMFRDDASYLLVGGFGGLGRSVATWLLEHGARNLVFLSRSAKNPDNESFVRELESYPGCVVTSVSGDVGNADDVLEAINSAPKPVAGVLQLSLVLKDNSTAEMTWEEWDGVVNPRVRGTWNVHQALLDAQVPLDFFVIFGSGGGHTGYYGQANYSASNTYLDAFVEYRHHLGLPASIIDLGVVGDVGYLLERDDLYENFKNGGFFFLKEQDVLDSAAIAVANSSGGPYSSFCLGGLSEKPLSDPTNRVNWKRDVRFAQSHYFLKSKTETVGEAKESDEAETFISLARSDPATLRDGATVMGLARFISATLSHLMLRPVEDFPLTESLTSIGLDSIISIELVDWIHQQFHIGLTSMEVTQCTSLMHLAEKITEELISSV
ncbi:Polyketide synthase [Colletotrichum higginsianum IMI 349063]|uniref:Polyketide synthase n=2 Tax=Colletotrichum higginsianum (strain IMI 349063) TaxID=759273 RepID=A0A1B7XWJ5_COLHI|nr:Polyketide synthase [Colletotrichum higginsianum IMI 349063]OBR04132.1 Polyketide synthase [Colletotrichum higginsianum IMI 349063]